MATNRAQFYVGLIDGTGPRDDADRNRKYRHAMGQGFCHQLYKQMLGLGQNATYAYGPGNSGAGLEHAINLIADKAFRHRDRRLILVGYSRGGLGCLLVARKLQKMASEGIPIHGMLLFDPVDRYPATGFGHSVPNNVEHSLRLYRKLDAGVVCKYEGSMSDFGDSVINRIAQANPFRPSFGHTGLGEEKGGLYAADNHPISWHVCSHGAMGGVGYRWVDTDPPAQESICAEVRAWFAEVANLRVRLEPGYDPDIGLSDKSPYLAGVRRKP